MIRNLIGDKNLDMTIISYRNYQDVDVIFENGYIAKNVQYMNFINNNIKNLLKPDVFNIGYIGGKVINKKAYSCWHAMIQRCYDPKRLSVRPDYQGCSVDKKWHNFQNFQEFYIQNYKTDYQLDKDMLFIGNKIYSENTCVFVPKEINQVFSKNRYKGVTKDKRGSKYVARLLIDGKREILGRFYLESEAILAFKAAKEKKIKNVAEKYKDLIDLRVYNNLINYKL